MIDLYSHEDPDSKLEEMLSVGDFDGIKVCVYSGEGPIPHIHFYSIWEGGLDGCIRLDSPQYFCHGKHISKLNAGQRKAAAAWFAEKPRLRFKRYDTNWEVLVELWNTANPQYELPENITMPDYSKLH